MGQLAIPCLKLLLGKIITVKPFLPNKIIVYHQDLNIRKENYMIEKYLKILATIDSVILLQLQMGQGSVLAEPPWKGCFDPFVPISDLQVQGYNLGKCPQSLQE